MDDDDLKIGDRVRLTPLGEQHNAGLRTRTGVIKGRTRGNGFYVLMDGNKTTSTLHRSYVEAEPALGGSATTAPSRDVSTGKSGC
jgi:hypothetical protein